VFTLAVRAGCLFRKRCSQKLHLSETYNEFEHLRQVEETDTGISEESKAGSYAALTLMVSF